MADIANLKCVFLPIGTRGKSRWRKLITYISLMYQTVRLLRSERPTEVWLQLPQVPLLWAALIYRIIFDQRVKLVADCHNAMFRPPWSSVPMGISVLRRCDLILVHNQTVCNAAVAMGLPADKTLVLEDVPPRLPQGPIPLPAILSRKARPWIIFPGSFSADEPIEEVLEAARILGDGTVVITGRTANAACHGHDISVTPDNVLLPGYLSVEEFNALLYHCDVVLALTKVDGIQLSVCNEALGFGKPVVMSDTSLLRSMFGEAAVMIRSDDPASLASGIRLATMRADQFSKASSGLADRRREQWYRLQYRRCRLILSA